MEKIAKILDNYKPIDMVRASLWIFNDWDSDIEESIENAGGIFSSVEEMRSEKLREIYFTLGLSGVKDLFNKLIMFLLQQGIYQHSRWMKKN